MPIQFRDYLRRRTRTGENDILYEISDEATVETISYYGYLAADGNWIIQKNDTSDGTYRYAAGSSDYAAAWAAKATWETSAWKLFSEL